MTQVLTNSQGKVYVANGKALLSPDTYPGLNSSFSNGYVTVNKGVLEDYSVSNITETGCLGKYNHVYNNFKIQGSPTINFSTGSISNISSTNFIQLYSTFPSVSSSDIIFRGKISTLNQIHPILSKYNTLVFIGINGTNKFGLFSSSWQEGTNVLSINTWYWFRIISSGSTITGYTLVDNDYVLDKLPDISQWRQEFTTTKSFFSATAYNIGKNYNQASQYWNGELDLSQSRIIFNGSLWWTAEGKSGIVKYNNTYTQTKGMVDNSSIPSGTTSLHIYYNPVKRDYLLDISKTLKSIQVGNKTYNCPYGGTVDITGYSSYPYYSISPTWGFYGSPTYNNADMSYSGFNSSTYLVTDYTFSMTPEQFSQGFTIQVHFVTPATMPNQYQRLLSCGSTYQYGPYLAIKPSGAGFDCGLATGGSVIIRLADTGQLSVSTEYWLRMTKTDSANDTVLQLSTNGTTWTTLDTNSGTITSNVTGNQTLKLGVAPDSSDQYFRGKIDLRDTFIEIAGTKVWSTLI